MMHDEPNEHDAQASDQAGDARVGHLGFAVAPGSRGLDASETGGIVDALADVLNADFTGSKTDNTITRLGSRARAQYLTGLKDIVAAERAAAIAGDQVVF